MQIFYDGDFCGFFRLGADLPVPTGKAKKAFYARHFDSLRNSLPTVSTYADGSELLVFGPFVTSASLSKDRLKPVASATGFFSSFFMRIMYNRGYKYKEVFL